jgi:hypothetical protein
MWPEISPKILKKNCLDKGLTILPNTLCFLHTPQGRFELLHMNPFLAFSIEYVDDLSFPQDAYALGPGERIFFEY